MALQFFFRSGICLMLVLVLFVQVTRRADAFNFIQNGQASRLRPPSFLNCRASSTTGDEADEGDRANHLPIGGLLQTRRSAVATTFGSAILALSNWPAEAAAEEGTTDDVSMKDILMRLRRTPVFCIVDSKGAPFMTYDGRSSANGYFFLNMKGALAVLDDARKKDVKGGATWEDATITKIPLDVATRLTLSKVTRTAQDGKPYSSVNDIVPSEGAVQEARLMDKVNPDRWTQQGRVPIFHIEGFEVEGRCPWYFSKAELLDEWKKMEPSSTTLPNVEVVEFVDLLRSLLQSKGKGLSTLRNAIFIPSKESVQQASTLSSSSPPTYRVADVILVGAANKK